MEEGLKGCDNNGAGVIRVDTGAQVASIHGLFPPKALAILSVKLAYEYNQAMLGIERNNHGHAVLAEVKTV